MQNGNVPNRAEQIDYGQMAKAWTKFTVSKLKDSLADRRIGVSQRLYNSTTGRVQGNTLNYLSIIIQYQAYGMFVDMGVRRGTKLKDAKIAEKRKNTNIKASNTRAKKKGLEGNRELIRKRNWYSTTIGKEQVKLAIFMASKSGKDAADVLLSIYPKRIELMPPRL
jgi:hypothetical protein